MSNILNSVTQVLNLYAPLTLGAIQMAEQAAPAGTSGTQKAEAVIAAVSAQVATTTGVPANVQTIAGLVNIGVSLLNAFGVFLHKSQAPAVIKTPAPAAQAILGGDPDSGATNTPAQKP